jgi:hypothetical protein
MDVLIALAVSLTAPVCRNEEPTPRRLLACGAIGAAAVWFSHSAVLVVSGIGFSLIVFAILRKHWQELAKVVVVCSSWALSFGVYYVVFLRRLVHDPDLFYYRATKARAFVPTPFFSAHTVKWLIDSFLLMFLTPAGLPLTGLAAFAFLVGCNSMWRDGKKEELFILVSPLGFTNIRLAAGCCFFSFPLSRC